MIRIFVTGGTFDKEYDEIGQRFIFTHTRVEEMVKLGKCKVPLEVETLFLKDSLEMTDDDREIISRRCERVDEERIVITHGTDTMDKTAKYLEERVHGKTIILTGAMIPFTFGSSDGFFNLGAALAFAEVLPHGVYIAMNGRYFSASNVRKNQTTGFFEELS